MTVLVQDPDLTIHVGDAREVLATLPDGSVNCCVTSPPYLGLRDYDHGDCPNGPDEHGQWPCEPSVLFGCGEAECQTCGRVAAWPARSGGAA